MNPTTTARGTTGFNPRLRTGGDHDGQVHFWASGAVSIHASAREATRARKRRKTERIVSIHASAREATGLKAARLVQVIVSIHASAREATPASACAPQGHGSFNPRLRTGGDSPPVVAVVTLRPVSIHASAREATGMTHVGAFFLSLFQSTPPHGRRPLRKL